MRRLAALLAHDPTNPRARFALARLEDDQGRARAETSYRLAAETFAKESDPRGEAEARRALAGWLARSGRLEEAAAEVEKATLAARVTGDPEVLIAVRLAEATAARYQSDWGRSWSIAKELEGSVFPAGPARLQSEVLSAMGAALWGLTRLHESLDQYRRQLEVVRREGDRFEEASARFNIALVTSGIEGRTHDLRRLETEALEAAVRGGNRRVEADARLAIGQDEALPLAARIENIQKALAIFREARAVEACFALRELARLRFETGDPVAADRLAEEAILLARRVGDPHHVARGFIRRALLHWADPKARQAAIADSLATLDAIERIRDIQPDGMVRARVISRWAFFYHLFVGHLTEPPGTQPAPADLDLAFRVTERLRARVLLDALDAAGVTGRISAGGPLQQRRMAILDRITQTQRRLLSLGEREGERATLLAELDRLEEEEGALRDEIARQDPSFAALRRPAIPSLSKVQRALGDDQALIAFQIALEGAHPEADVSVVFSVTRGGARVYRLRPRRELEAEARQFLGLLEWRDGDERRGAARLYRDLLGQALTELPAGITRLVIVPDGVLHRVPFDPLRAQPEAEPLGTLRTITITPSAAVWLRLRRRDRQGPVAAVPDLALADPDVSAGGEAAAFRQAAPWNEPLRLGPLPYARLEARDLVRRMGRRSVMLMGAAASERSLKTTPLSRFRVLHLAAHAVTDDDKPERSAILLAPGAAEEDGLLQMREVVELHFDRMLVVLSACSSASGAYVAGEGVMGLARAFLQAGAQTVVGGLWPLRDDEAARLVEEFAAGLGRGLSVAEALAAARRQRALSGAPTAAWAGLVAIGDGDAVPLPGGARSTPSGGVLTALLVMAALTLALALAARRRSPAD